MSRTYEELKAGFERIEAAQACRNLMGKYSYLHTAMRNIDFMNLWANRDDDILAMPWGYYLGIEGVRKCYLEDHGDRSDPQVQASPIFKGGMMMHAMDTAVIEVAKDGKTAKGVWLSPGHESCYIPDFSKFPDWKKGDPLPENLEIMSSCEWAWSKYYVDFIKEDGEWKFWRLRLWPIFMCRGHSIRTWMKWIFHSTIIKHFRNQIGHGIKKSFIRQISRSRLLHMTTMKMQYQNCGNHLYSEV